MHGGVSGLVSTGGVIFDRLARGFFHQGNVFMGRRVVHHFRPVTLEYVPQAAAVPHGPDFHAQRQIRIAAPQFQLNIIGVILADVKNNQFFGLVAGNLAAQFAANGTAAARH